MSSDASPFSILSCGVLPQTGGCAALMCHASIAESMHAPSFDARPSRNRCGVVDRFYGDGRGRSEVVSLDT